MNIVKFKDFSKINENNNQNDLYDFFYYVLNYYFKNFDSFRDFVDVDEGSMLVDVDFKDITIYIYRERKDNNAPALSRPCASCRKMLHDLGIRTICYTEDDGYTEEKFIQSSK